MGKAARKYTEQTLKQLFGLSGNQCSFPGCSKILVNKNNAKDSNICHIEAANEKGERYNENMTDIERAHYNNLILLCIQHHDETNNEKIYTVDTLKAMKANHEAYIASLIIKENPSMLKNTINALADINLDEIKEEEPNIPFNPKVKIKYNNLKKNASLINEYKVYFNKINLLYTELERQGSIKKDKLLSTIKIIYSDVKGKYVQDNDNEILLIQKNADAIFDDTYECLFNKVKDSHFFEEDIIIGLKLIMVDAFMRCKILEEPI